MADFQSLPPSIAANQKRCFLQLWAELLPWVRKDTGFGSRLENCLRREKKFGSRDRRLYRELLYTAVRHLPWIEGLSADEQVAHVAAWAEEAPATRGFRLAWARKEGDSVVNAPKGASPADLLPSWFRAECEEAFSEKESQCLRTRTPLWLRIQCDAPNEVKAEWASRNWTYEVDPELPSAWKMVGDYDIRGTTAYEAGALEVQDLGSQMILEHAGVHPGECWYDACAGAGGKTLQLAQMLAGDGSIDAGDIRADALEELRNRATRAGFRNTPSGSSRQAVLRKGNAPGVTLRIAAPPRRDYDAVLLDAPCSGTGTWRRAPHLKWSTTLAGIRESAVRQLRLLRENADRVKSGGRLVYATCSLCKTENSDVVRGFLSDRIDFSPERPEREFGYGFDGFGTTIMPALRNSDGFYVAILRKK